MIRHNCAACGRAINRMDRFFEPSDGTLCQDCLARQTPGKPCRMAPPPWATLPALLPRGTRR